METLAAEPGGGELASPEDLVRHALAGVPGNQQTGHTTIRPQTLGLDMDTRLQILLRRGRVVEAQSRNVLIPIQALSLEGGGAVPAVGTALIHGHHGANAGRRAGDHALDIAEIEILGVLETDARAIKILDTVRALVTPSIGHIQPDPHLHLPQIQYNLTISDRKVIQGIVGVGQLRTADIAILEAAAERQGIQIPVVEQGIGQVDIMPVTGGSHGRGTTAKILGE